MSLTKAFELMNEAEPSEEDNVGDEKNEAGSGSGGEGKSEAGSEEQEEQQEEMQFVQVRDEAVAQYFLLKGTVNESKSTDRRIYVDFLCGAPSKTFLPNQLETLPADASPIDRLSPNSKVWLSRGPGVPSWTQSYLKHLPKKRCRVKSLGYNQQLKKFVFMFADESIVALSFKQTGVIHEYRREVPDSDSSSDKKKDSSSDEDEK